jgi:phosphoribosylformylglycinamidine cyclo-ligase
VEKERIIDGSQVRGGDVLLGIASSGPHSNGYSLIRKVITVSRTDLHQAFHGRSLGDTLLEPTRIYVKSLLALIADVPVLALAHITGGGITENLPRVLPDHCRAVIHTRSWQRPPVFDWLQSAGGIAAMEMYRTFNCGIGMIVCVRAEQADVALKVLRQQGETVWRIGEVEPRRGEEDQVILRDS